MIGGFSTSILWVVFAKENFYDLYEMVPGFIVGMALTIIVIHFTHSKIKSKNAHATSMS